MGQAELKFVVQESQSGLRLDAVLAAQFGHLSRAFFQRSIAAGSVLVNGKIVRHRVRLQAGMLVGVQQGIVQVQPVEPYMFAEDAWLLVKSHVVVVNKPGGMPIHPLNSLEPHSTLFHTIVKRFPEVAHAGPDPNEGGILHRLDTGTSGIVVAARTREAHAQLSPLFRGQGAIKTYLALTAGRLPDTAGIIEYPVAHHFRDRRKMCAVLGDSMTFRGTPRSAVTSYRVLQVQAGVSLVELTLSRGQRHQLRVHLAALGCPLLGDTLYGGDSVNGLTRHALHAAGIRFVDPVDGQQVDIDIALPQDMAILAGQ